MYRRTGLHLIDARNPKALYVTALPPDPKPRINVKFIQMQYQLLILITGSNLAPWM